MSSRQQFFTFLILPLKVQLEATLFSLPSHQILIAAGKWMVTWMVKPRPPHFRFSSCSYYVEKSRKGKTPVSRQSSGLLPAAAMGDLFIVSVSMIAEKLRVAKQSQGYGAPELNRYLTVYFDYSSESDIPTMLTLASRYTRVPTLRNSRHNPFTVFLDYISRTSQNK